VPIRAHAQKDYIQARPVAVSGLEDAGKFMGVVSRGQLEVCLLGVHAMKVLGWNIGVIKESFTDHPIVAVRVVGWNAAFIHLKQLDILPANASGEGWASENLI
jgi:hypothetical protein